MEYNSRMRCAGKVGVVTGCTAGIGLATITKMVEEGAEVYMLVRNLEKAKPIAEELNKKGPGRVADMIWFDARMIETIEPAIKKAYEEAGRIDMFVNNAIGTGDVSIKDNGTITETTHENMMKLTEGTLGVSAECLRVVIPLMIAGGGGSIVNTGSTTGAQADTTRTYYGVGSPSPMPFELDIEKHNLLAGYTLKAFALYGLGKHSEAELCIRRAEELDPNDFAVYTYRQMHI